MVTKLLPFIAELKTINAHVFFELLFYKKQIHSYPITILHSAEFIVEVIDMEVQLLDVRTPREYESEHIKGALNIDWFQPFKFKITVEKLN